eukprot:scaffold15648_cov130-Isochrysis_galbana.AAC.3
MAGQRRPVPITRPARTPTDWPARFLRVCRRAPPWLGARGESSTRRMLCATSVNECLQACIHVRGCRVHMCKYQDTFAFAVPHLCVCMVSSYPPHRRTICHCHVFFHVLVGAAARSCTFIRALCTYSRLLSTYQAGLTADIPGGYLRLNRRLPPR